MQKFSNFCSLSIYFLNCDEYLILSFIKYFGIKIIHTFFLHCKDLKEKLITILLKIAPEAKI